jgi:large subunit ribosomal protein L27
MTIQGRDHTIHAAQPGYVRYYKDPAKHPKRQYIGIVFEKDQQLPAPVNAVRRRKLGMLAYQMPTTYEAPTPSDLTTGTQTDLEGNADSSTAQATTIRELPNNERATLPVKDALTGRVVENKLTLRPGYQYRQANWEIGRAAERSKAAMMVKPFRPGDRFAAWRKASLRIAKNAERRTIGRGAKKAKRN